MHVPGLGLVTEEPDTGWLASEPVPLPVLGRTRFRVILEEYEDDPDREQLHAVIRALLSADPSVLRAAEPYLYAYYQDCRRAGLTELELASPGDVWEHVEWQPEVAVGRDGDRVEHVYASVEGECAWEPEHGLQIVLEDGVRVCKVGPFDGHMTNESAYADERLRGVVYHGAGSHHPREADPPHAKKPWWKLW